MQKDNPYVTHLAVLAIVVSAAGTAVASLSTWGDSASSELRASKTLAQLQQLHWRVASDILKSNVLCSKPDDADWKESVRLQADLMDSWRDRYESVSDGAAAALARPGDLGSKPAAGRPPPDDAQKGGEGSPAPPAAASDAQKPHPPQSGANQMRSAVNVTRTPPR